MVSWILIMTCWSWLAGHDVLIVTCWSWLADHDLLIMTCWSWLTEHDLLSVTYWSWLTGRDFLNMTCLPTNLLNTGRHISRPKCYSLFPDLPLEGGVESAITGRRTKHQYSTRLTLRQWRTVKWQNESNNDIYTSWTPIGKIHSLSREPHSVCFLISNWVWQKFIILCCYVKQHCSY